MKKILIFIAMVVFSLSASSQTPTAIQYQVVVRDNSGNLQAGENIGFRLSIIHGNPSGVVAYCESHVVLTSQFGIATLEIGHGTVISGNFSAIEWGNSSYYLKTEIDPTGGNSFQEMGISQFLAVPFSFHSKTAGNGLPSGLEGQSLRHDGSSWVGSSTLFNDGTRIAVGTTTPESSAALEINSSDKGFLPPRMTKAERDGILNPTAGLTIFCTNCVSGGITQVFYSGKWHSQKFNSYPVATNVSQTGTPSIGQLFTGQYIYSDADNDLEGSSAYKWYRADNPSGLNEQEITGETGIQYMTTSSDQNKYIRFSVIPVALSGDSPGDEVKSPSFLGPVSWGCGSTFTDIRDGKIYTTVLIGTQCWMKQNLNVGTKITEYPLNNGIIEKYCYWDQDSKCEEYGGMYRWDEMMNYTSSSNSVPSGRQGICPAGWHIPSDAEWDILVTNQGGLSLAGGKLKETGFSHWLDPNTGATNSSGFTAFGGGVRTSTGTYSSLTGSGLFQTSTESTSSNAWYYSMTWNSASAGRYDDAKSFSRSVRCIKD